MEKARKSLLERAKFYSKLGVLVGISAVSLGTCSISNSSTLNESVRNFYLKYDEKIQDYENEKRNVFSGIDPKFTGEISELFKTKEGYESKGLETDFSVDSPYTRVSKDLNSAISRANEKLLEIIRLEGKRLARANNFSLKFNQKFESYVAFPMIFGGSFLLATSGLSYIVSRARSKKN